MEFLIQKGSINRASTSPNFLQETIECQKNSIIVISEGINEDIFKHAISIGVFWIPRSEWEIVKNLPNTALFKVEFPNDANIKLYGGNDPLIGKIMEVFEGDS